MNNAQIPTGKIRSVSAACEQAHSLEDGLCPFDFRHPRELRAVVPHVDGFGQPGLDHCFVVDGYDGDHDRHHHAGDDEKPLLPVAVLFHPGSGRSLSVWSTQPGVQVYSSNWLPSHRDRHDDDHDHDDDHHQASAAHEGRGQCADGDLMMQQHCALCLETQHFPDAVNHAEEWGSALSTICSPEHPYAEDVLFRFS